MLELGIRQPLRSSFFILEVVRARALSVIFKVISYQSANHFLSLDFLPTCLEGVRA